MESNGFSIATNILIASNQRLSTCPENPFLKNARCDSKRKCKTGSSLYKGNGIMTGRCIPSDYINVTYNVCEIIGWCPVLRSDGPLKEEALLISTRNFTVMIKNFVEFTEFQVRRRNVFNDKKNYLEDCLYNPLTDATCPIFLLDDIVRLAGEDYEMMSVKGGVIAIIIYWNCDFDYDINLCIPKYYFRRLDDPNDDLAPGLSWRFAHYYNDTWRSLYKANGIKFVIMVYGQGGKLSIIPLLINLGSGVGLLVVARLVGDFVILFVADNKETYKNFKYVVAEEKPVPTECVQIQRLKRSEKHEEEIQ